MNIKLFESTKDVNLFYPILYNAPNKAQLIKKREQQYALLTGG